MKIKFEYEIVEVVVELLNSEGYKVRLEVPNMGQCADIVATNGRWITFIEAKIYNWKRAFKQCIAHELVADYICVALASVKYSPKLVDEAQKLGYGIIHCNRIDGKCKWILRPRLNKNIWKPQRQILSKSLKEIEYAS